MEITIVVYMITSFVGGWFWARATAPDCSIKEHWLRDTEERRNIKEAKNKNEKLPPVKS